MPGSLQSRGSARRWLAAALVALMCLAAPGCTIVESSSASCGYCGMALLNGRCYQFHPGASCATCGGPLGADSRCHRPHGAGGATSAGNPNAPCPVCGMNMLGGRCYQPHTRTAAASPSANCPTCGYMMFNGRCNQPHARANAPCPVCGMVMIGGRCNMNHTRGQAYSPPCPVCGAITTLYGGRCPRGH